MTALSKPDTSLSKATLGFALLATAAFALPRTAAAETDGWDLLVGAAVAYAVYDAVDGDRHGRHAHYGHDGYRGRDGYYYRDGYRFYSKKDYKRWRKHQRRLAKQRRRLEKHIRKHHRGYYDGGYCPHESHRYFSDSRNYRQPHRYRDRDRRGHRH